MLDTQGDSRYQLRVRASGTEPINRIYVESKDPVLGRKIMDAALERLELLTIDEICKAYSEWRLVDMLSQTRPTEKTHQAVVTIIADKGWKMPDVTTKLVKSMQILENRNRKIAQKWLDALS